MKTYIAKDKTVEHESSSTFCGFYVSGNTYEEALQKAKQGAGWYGVKPENIYLVEDKKENY